MNDKQKTKAQLIDELAELRQRVAELEALDAERKQVEEVHRESEHGIQRLIEHAADAFFLHDLEGRILDVNQRACDSLGYTREELLKLSMLDIDTALSREVMLAEMKRQASGDTPVTGQGMYRRKDGTTFPVEVRGSLIESGERQLILALARSVTRRMETTEQVNFQAQLLDCVRESIVSTDLEGEVIYWGKGAEALYGYSAEEVMGKPITFIAEPKHEAVEQQRRRQVRETGLWSGQYMQKRKDGSSFWADTVISLVKDENGQPCGLVGIDRDITERKQAEEELRRYTERLRILREIDQGILAAQSPEEIAQSAVNHIRHLVPCLRSSVTLFDFEANRFTVLAAHFSGETRLKAVGEMPLENLGNIDDLQHGKVRLVEDIQNRTQMSSNEQMLLAKGIRSYVTVPLMPEGHLIGTLNLGLDAPGAFSGEQIEIVQEVANSLAVALQNARLYEQVQRHAEELERTQKHIIQQERLHALGQMASGITHDFNNALSPILGFCELLLMSPKNLGDKEKATRYLQMMSTAAKDAATVVRRLREFYRPREIDEILHPVNLNRLIESAIPLTQPRWQDQAQGNGITIQIKTELQEVPQISANETEIREVLTNLIFNAVDAMPIGGTITIRTRSDGQHVLLEVSDTGTGMTDEVRQRCLEPFFSTKGGRGTGLGLSMVFGIIQRHKGAIDIESEPGHGTTFRIRLRSGERYQAAPIGRTPESISRSLHVLLVEDKTTVSQMVTEYLIIDGHTVETAINGRMGLEKFHAGQFDLVVTDRAMPDMNGDQLAGFIKQIAPNKPVIMLTGFGDFMQAAGEHPAGVDVIVSKPVTLSAFRQALVKVMADSTEQCVAE
ncbi:MAG: PAS domain S-box protein [Candidatus Poribacteria bacterium]|nr:PAS domain S-box protein [Candidatus Poribacteria bacterium]